MSNTVIDLFGEILQQEVKKEVEKEVKKEIEKIKEKYKNNPEEIINSLVEERAKILAEELFQKRLKELESDA